MYKSFRCLEDADSWGCGDHHGFAPYYTPDPAVLNKPRMVFGGRLEVKDLILPDSALAPFFTHHDTIYRAQIIAHH